MRIYTINWILLIILSAIWGGAFTLNKEALNNFTPELIVTGRLLIGSFILVLLVYLIQKRIKFEFKQLKYFLVMSIIGIVVPFLFIAHGQKNIDSALAGILMATMPISTLILAHFYLSDESMTRKKLIGFILAFLGIVILILPDKIDFQTKYLDNLYSQLMVIFGAILYSAAAVYGKLYKNTDALNASTGTIFFSAIIMFIYLYFFITIDEKFVMAFSSIPIILLGVFCTAIATILYFQILQTSGASFLSIMNYLIPAWAIIFGVIFFNEKILWNYFLGLFIIILGIKISQKDVELDQEQRK